MWTHSLTHSVIIIFLYLKTSREGGGCYDLIPPHYKRQILLSIGEWAGLIAGLGVVVERNWYILLLTEFEYRTPSPLLLYTKPYNEKTPPLLNSRG